MSDSLISSFLVSDVSELLISLKSNERCERIPHFAHQKWATMSDSLRSLRGNERMSDSLKKFWLKNLKSCFLVCFLYDFFYLVSYVSKLLRSLTKMSDVRESLKSLTKNERMSQSLIFLSASLIC